MDAVVSTCEAAASYLVRRPDQIIPHGVDTTYVYRPAESRQATLKARRVEMPRVIGIVRASAPTKRHPPFCSDLYRGVAAKCGLHGIDCRRHSTGPVRLCAGVGPGNCQAGLSDRIRYIKVTGDLAEFNALKARAWRSQPC